MTKLKGFPPGTQFREYPPNKDFNPPQGYWDCVDRMQAEAVRWVRAHPFAELRFNHKLSDELATEAGHPGKKIAFAAPIPLIIDRYGLNQDTRDFLWALERASHSEGTFLQVQAMVETQIEEMIRKATMRMPEGDWSCLACPAKIDAYTNEDLDPAPPPPGAYTLCSQCGHLQKVNDTANGYAEVSKREFNQLPTSIRKQLMKGQNAIRKALERQKAAAERAHHNTN